MSDPDDTITTGISALSIADDGAASSDGGGEETRLYIRAPHGLRFHVHANLNSTVRDFKKIIGEKCDIPPRRQRLIHKGRLLKDDQTLTNYGVKGDATIYLIRSSAIATDASTSTDDGSNRPPFGPSFFPELAEMRDTILNNPLMRALLNRYLPLRLRLNDPATLYWLMNGVHYPEIVPEMVRMCDQVYYSLTQNMTNSPAPNPSPSTATPAPNPSPSTATGSTRRLDSVAFGDLNFVELERMMYYLTDPETSNEMMEVPEIAITISNMLSNPQYLIRILAFNPELEAVLNSNPEIRDMMQSPEFIGRFATPAIVNELLECHRKLLALAADGGTGDHTAPRALETLMDMCRRFNEYHTNKAARGDHAEQYLLQLSQLEEMGFNDRQQNIQALTATGGILQSAIERLLANANPPS